MVRLHQILALLIIGAAVTVILVPFQAFTPWITGMASAKTAIKTFQVISQEKNARKVGAIGYLVNDDGQLTKRLNQLSKSINLLNVNFLQPVNATSKGYRILVFTDSADKIKSDGHLNRWMDDYKDIEIITIEPGHPDFKPPAWLKGGHVSASCGGRIWREGYIYMNVFRLWNMTAHPALDNFEFFLRLDTDMYFEKKIPFDPFQRMEEEHLIYGYTECTMEKLIGCVDGLPEAVGRYVRSRNFTPAHLEHIDWGLAYAGNFGAMRISWFRQDQYRDFVQYLLDIGGVYSKRWADQNIWALALALYAPKNQIGQWESLFHDGVAVHKSEGLGTAKRKKIKQSEVRSPMPLCKRHFGCVCHHDGTSRFRLEKFQIPNLLARKAYVTYIVGDEFLPGALVLWKSLLDTGSLKSEEDGPVDFVCMHFGLSSDSLDKLQRIGAVLIGEQQLQNLSSPYAHFKDRYKDSQWKMFSKLNVFGLEQYDRVVYMDADMMVLKSVRFLLYNTTPAIGAVAEKPELTPEFNAGLIVIDPSSALLEDMVHHLDDNYSCGYRATDQSFLCHYFHPLRHGWHSLNATLNKLWKMEHGNPNALETAHVFHFNGNKPWLSPGMNGVHSKQWHSIYSRALTDDVFLL